MVDHDFKQRQTGASPGAMRGKVKAAFAHRPYPGDDHIVFERIDCGGHESAETDDYFRGRNWRSISLSPDNRLNGPAPGLNAYMTPEAQAYFLPAFLLLALELAGETEDEALTAMAESLCFSLTRPSPTSLSVQYAFVKDMLEVPEVVKDSLRVPTAAAKATERALVDNFDRLVAILTEAERAAIAGTLVYLSEVFRQQSIPDQFNDARRALASTWAHFL